VTYVNLGSGITASAGATDFPSGGTPGQWSVTSAAGGDRPPGGVEGVVGTRFADRLFGGSDTSQLFRGGAGDDILSGGYASAASDTLYGGDGNDVISGAEETGFDDDIPAGTGDSLYGGNGNDRLAGVDGDDRLFGDAGGDRLSGGRGRDVLTGGGGADRFAYNNVDTGDYGTTDDFGRDLITDFVRGTDEIAFSAGGDEFSGPELEGFADLDSDGNGVLDGRDERVDVRQVSFGGATKASTVIDVTDLNYAGSGEHSLTVFGVTGLRAGDFVDPV
jgi:Ca2+-binding RTX toxin-like protein